MQRVEATSHVNLGPSWCIHNDIPIAVFHSFNVAFQQLSNWVCNLCEVLLHVVMARLIEQHHYVCCQI